MYYADEPVFTCEANSTAPACTCTPTQLQRPPHACLAGDLDNARTKMTAQLLQPGYQVGVGVFEGLACAVGVRYAQRGGGAPTSCPHRTARTRLTCSTLALDSTRAGRWCPPATTRAPAHAPCSASMTITTARPTTTTDASRSSTSPSSCTWRRWVCTPTAHAATRVRAATRAHAAAADDRGVRARSPTHPLPCLATDPSLCPAARGIQVAYTFNAGTPRAVDLLMLDERWDRAPLPCAVRRDWWARGSGQRERGRLLVQSFDPPHALHS